MSDKNETIDRMVDYVGQLRRHTKGRRAIHVKMSVLEPQFRQQHYKLAAASALRGLVTKFGATLFSLPNSDIVMVVKGASMDDIEPALLVIRRKLKTSSIVASLDPVQGVSDNFVGWFDLEKYYGEFQDYVTQLAEALRTGGSIEAITPTTDKKKKKGKLTKPKHQEPLPPPPKRHVRMMPIDPPPGGFENRELDPELLLAITKALQGADIAGQLKKQRIMAIVGGGEMMPVLVHKWIPRRELYETLLKGKVLGANRWLDGYLEDFVAKRVLASTPSMTNESSLASSIRVTAAAVLSEAFDLFDTALGSQPKSKVVMEFGAVDAIANPVTYNTACEKLRQFDYRISIADLHPLSFLAIEYDQLKGSFVKLVKPEGPVGDWLTNDTEFAIQRKVEQVGQARIIFDGCDDQSDIDLGHLLGITLFQGSAVSPMADL